MPPLARHPSVVSRIFWRASFVFGWRGLAGADDKGALRSFNHVVGDDGEVVDFHHSFDLREKMLQGPEVTARDSGDRGDGLSIGEVFKIERLTQVTPVVL